MKPYLEPFEITLAASEERSINAPCNFVRIVTVTGTCKVSINGGDSYCKITTGDQLKADTFQQFDKITFRATDAVTLYAIFGVGSMTGGGGGASAGYAGSGSPEGAQTANTGATYYNTADGSFWVKSTGTGNTGWIQLIA